jgi:hypothetical protein
MNKVESGSFFEKKEPKKLLLGHFGASLAERTGFGAKVFCGGGVGRPGPPGHFFQKSDLFLESFL